MVRTSLNVERIERGVEVGLRRRPPRLRGGQGWGMAGLASPDKQSEGFGAATRSRDHVPLSW